MILLGVCNCIIVHIYTLMSVMFNFMFSVSFFLSELSDSLSFLRVAVLDKVTDFLLFLGKLLIVGLVGESL